MIDTTKYSNTDRKMSKLLDSCDKINIVLLSTMLKNYVDAGQAVKICGFKTISMLDYLERSGVFVRRSAGEKRRGKGRRYNFRDLLILKVMSNLLSNGASVQALKKALLEFQDAKWTADRASLGFDDKKIRYLSVSGGTILFAASDDNFYDMTKGGQMLFSFIVDMDRLHTELCADLDQQEFKFRRATARSV